MNSKPTMPVSTGLESNAFVALTETEMNAVRGGTAWPDWIVDLVDDIVANTDEVLDYLDTIVQTKPLDFDGDYWDDVHETLQDEGFIIPDPGGI